MKHYLILNCSPHKKSRTKGFCILFAKHLSNCTYEVINLPTLPPSDGTYKTPNQRVRSMQEKVLKCDGIFIATPTYWFNVPATLKAFLEQLTPIDNRLWVKERLLALVVYSPHGGELGVFNALVPPLTVMGFSMIGNGYAWHRGGTKMKEEWVKNEIISMANRFSPLSPKRV